MVLSGTVSLYGCSTGPPLADPVPPVVTGVFRGATTGMEGTQGPHTCLGRPSSTVKTSTPDDLRPGTAPELGPRCARRTGYSGEEKVVRTGAPPGRGAGERHTCLVTTAGDKEGGS